MRPIEQVLWKSRGRDRARDSACPQWSLEPDRERHEPAGGDSAEQVFARFARTDEDDQVSLLRRGGEGAQPGQGQCRPPGRVRGSLDVRELVERRRRGVDERADHGLVIAGDHVEAERDPLRAASDHRRCHPVLIDNEPGRR